VRSEGFGLGDPAVLPTAYSAGQLPPQSSDNIQLPAYAYLEQSKGWGTPPASPAADVLDITATNIASLAIDPLGAHVDCHAHLNITTDGPVQVSLLGCPAGSATTATTVASSTSPGLPVAMSGRAQAAAVYSQPGPQRRAPRLSF
jgi:hypothetical protein